MEIAFFLIHPSPSCCFYKANKILKYYNTPNHLKVNIASFHMDEEALIWFQDTEESGLFINWEAFMKASQLQIDFVVVIYLFF